MKYFINSIEDEIEKQKNKNNINLIKLEGIEDPYIYKEICKYFKHKNLDFQAKLSKEKFEEFKREFKENEKEKNSIEFLEKNNFVDFDGAMTKWRNSISINVNPLKEKLILLMGTELVQDKGGLADFYTINSEIVARRLKKDGYFSYFENIIKDNNFSDKDKDGLKIAINTIFKEIFDIFPVDLIKISYIAEELEEKDFKYLDDIIENIFAIIPKYWSIPYIFKARPSFNQLKNPSSKKINIIKKAYNFMSRKDYRNSYPSKNKLNNIVLNLEKYVINNNIDINNKFPDGIEVFNDFNEFSKVLVSFIKGINVEENKKKLMELDFSIINEILNLKDRNKLGSNDEEEKPKKVFGEPIEVYSKLLLENLNNYRNKIGYYPNEVIFEVKSIILGNCIDNDDFLEEYKSISSYLGGLIDFINKENFEIYGETLDVKYSNYKDPFSQRKLNIVGEDDAFIEGLEDIEISKSKNINVFSKIEFIITTKKEDEVKFTEWVWKFKSTSSWKNQFLLCKNIINKELDFTEELPLGWYCENLNELISYENEDEFLNRLKEVKLIPIDYKIEFLSQINKELNLLKHFFKDMSISIFKNGFFYDIQCEDSKIYKFIDKYERLLNEINLKFNQYKPSEKEKIFIALNLFNIGKNNKEGITESDYENLIMPPINPIVLEKIVNQQVFIRRSVKDLLISSLSKETDNTTLKSKVEKMFHLSELSTGAGAFLGKKNLITADKVMANYVIYKNLDFKSEEVLNGYNNLMIEDEDINISNFTKVSSESSIISENIIDYIKIFPTRADGIKITMLNPKSLQYIVSGINTVVKHFKDDGINIYLTIVRNKNEKNGVDYIKYWLDNKLSEKNNTNVKTFILNKNFKSRNLIDDLENTLKQQDIIFVGNILTTKSVELKEDFKNNYEEDEESKYPMVFPPLPLCKSSSKRAINITQQQFSLEYEHTQLLNRLKNPSSKDGVFKVVKEVYVDENKNEMLQRIHNISKWVVCIDESIDKELLANKDKGHIVGFTTGKGNFGELNVTVSARNDILEDIKIKLKNRLKKQFRSWGEKEEILDSVAEFCIKISENLDGGKILKALNSSDYEINSFLSYIITLQYLKIPSDDDKYIIRILLNLDSHMHWFEQLVISDSDKMRPDLLLLEIKKDDFCDDYGNLKIKATVIECKMGNSSNDKTKKAIKQVKKGILSLSKIWDQSIKTSRRYWSNQLYRALIFSKINIIEDDYDYESIMSKIEGVLQGKYKISWSGKIFEYWIDSNKLDVKEEFVEDTNDIEHITSDLKIIECGQLYIKEMLLPKDKRDEKQVFEEEEILENKDEWELEDLKLLSKKREKKNGNILDDKKTEKDNVDKEKTSIEDRKEYDNLPNEDLNYRNINNIRVLVGKDERNNKEVYWEYGNKDLNNRHLFISGKSGTGKTYCIQCLLYELAKQGVPAIIFDYTDGFTEEKLDPIFKDLLGEKLKSYLIRSEKFKINPFKRQKISISGYEQYEDSVDIARRIAETFKFVYSLGDQQFSNLYKAIKIGVEKYGDKMNFAILGEELEALGTREAKSTLSKIQIFLDTEAFKSDSEFSWDKIINSNGEVFIIQLTGYTRDIQTLLTTLVLWDIWNYARRFGSEDKPFVLVLDEAQNLDHSERSPSGYILTEGRKFGVSGWYATQFLKGQINNGEIGRLQQAAEKIYFAPPEFEIKDIAKSIDSEPKETKFWQEKLKLLGKGECIVSGPIKSKNNEKLVISSPKVVKVSSLEERRDGN